MRSWKLAFKKLRLRSVDRSQNSCNLCVYRGLYEIQTHPKADTAFGVQPGTFRPMKGLILASASRINLRHMHVTSAKPRNDFYCS